MADTEEERATTEAPNILLGCTLSGQHLSRDDDTMLVRGQVAKVTLVVSFTSLEWEDLTTYARFECPDGETVVDVAETEGETGRYLVPHEATDVAGTFCVSIKGESADGTLALTSCPVTYRTEDTIGGEGGEPTPATPSMLAQVLANSEAARAAADAATEAVEKADAAEEERAAAEEERTANEAQRKDNEAARQAAAAAMSDATDKANQAASAADTATAAANAAATKADTATANATDAASKAEDAAEKADTATANANAATTAANAAATKADTATANATDAASKAEDAAEKAAAAVSGYPIWDEDAGRYTDDSIAAMLAKRSDGLMYGYSQPKGSSVELAKLGALASMAAPTPGTNTVQAVNPYAAVGPFFYLTVNGTVDDDGTPHVTAIEGDGRFSSDGSNGNVYTLAPCLWVRQVETGEAVETWFSDSYQPGYATQPGGLLPDGTRRRFILYAAKGGSVNASGKLQSVSGQPLKCFVSHNALSSLTDSATTGLAGKTAADDWYLRTMYRAMFGRKSNDQTLKGCISYSYGYAPAVAETGVNRVVLTTAQAGNLLVGSSMMLGNANATGASIDRGQAQAYNVFSARRITAITALADDELTTLGLTGAYSAVTFEGDAFDTLTTDWLQTAPWHTGCCDGVLGGLGSPSNPTSGKEPFVLQGIECMYGAYEVLHNVILDNTGDGWSVLVCHDTQTGSINSTSAYEDTGLDLPTDSADSWKYPLHDVEAGGMLVPQGTGASQSTGLCDGCYTSKLATTGQREWRSLGHLVSGGDAGLSCVAGDYALSRGGWYYASRLSGNGRSRG